jgi:hypothetical protein
MVPFFIMDWNALFKSPFTWGLALGVLFFVLSAWGHFKTKNEFRRYRKHLSDKLDLDAAQLEALKREKESLLKENENLRLRIGMLAEKPDAKIGRDLEILARAEKRMVLRAPGFAPAWEAAKSEAADEVAHEEMGKSLPKRFFNRLFGNASLKLLDSAQGEAAQEAASGNQTSAAPAAPEAGVKPAA